MRERCTTVRKQCPPHQWAAVTSNTLWDPDCPVYVFRRCGVCGRREHAIVEPDVIESTPRTLWHLADAAWTAV